MQRIRWWPTLLVLAAILWLTLAPHPLPENHIELFEGADKIVHCLMFLTLTLAFLFDLSDYKNKLSWAGVTISSICIMIFAAFDEWMQGAMAMGRTTEVYDFIADCAGIALAANFWLFNRI